MTFEFGVKHLHYLKGAAARCDVFKKRSPSLLKSVQHIPHRGVIPPPAAWSCHLSLVELASNLRQRQALSLQLGNERLKLLCSLASFHPILGSKNLRTMAA